MASAHRQRVTMIINILWFVVLAPVITLLVMVQILAIGIRRIEPLDGTLALLNVAGGNIRNIALNAAFLAADVGQPVQMAHLLRATRSEYAKLEKPLTAGEIKGWM